MAVGITYTGVDGKRTAFSSASAEDAIGRLSSIKGYRGNLMDAAAAGLAGAFAAKHKNAARVASLGGARTTFNGVKGGSVFSGDGGKVVKLPTLAGLKFENGRIVSTSQDKYLSDKGAVVATGANRERTVAEVPTTEDVKKTAESVAKTVAQSIAEAAATNAAKGAGGREIEVITDISFDTSTGPLKIVVTKAKVNVTGISNATSDTRTIGEEVMVHESMSIDRHSYVWVLARRKNVPSVEAKVKT